MRKKVLIMGAAGRDFHNFNMRFRNDPACEVVAFTAAQIPFISGRVYPPPLAGPLYPDGIPIYPEDELEGLIRSRKVDEVIFSYSDVPHEYVMHRASIAIALGADFVLFGADKTMLDSRRPVVSVCAVRTGSGKSGVTRYIAGILRDEGLRPAVVRHPMPYGDLLRQRAQRFRTMDEVRAAGCTIEEMEEFEPLVNEDVAVYAGVDYAEVLKGAEEEGDVIIWDGGNNDLPFIRPGLELVVADPLRTGHEYGYHPGEANARRADFVIINKANAAGQEDIRRLEGNIRSLNPSAGIIRTASVIRVSGDIRGKRALVIEDGPTLTHGGMGYGAGAVAARENGALPVDPAPYAIGTIRQTLSKYPHITNVLPAMGYSKEQILELEATINATPCDIILIATPVDLSRVVGIKKPCVRVTYGVEEIEEPGLRGVIRGFASGVKRGGR